MRTFWLLCKTFVAALALFQLTPPMVSRHDTHGFLMMLLVLALFVIGIAMPYRWAKRGWRRLAHR